MFVLKPSGGTPLLNAYEVEALLNERAVKLESMPDKDNTHFSHVAKVPVHTA